MAAGILLTLWLQVEAKLRFIDLDTDGDGVLDRTEVPALVGWVWSNFKPSDAPLSREEEQTHSAYLMALCDKNRDGLINFGEFSRWFEGAWSSHLLCRLVSYDRLASSASASAYHSPARALEAAGSYNLPSTTLVYKRSAGNAATASPAGISLRSNSQEVLRSCRRLQRHEIDLSVAG